jgi:hypothetical protein
MPINPYCDHHWQHVGSNTYDVVCVRCGAAGKVSVVPLQAKKPPTHLEQAREDHENALLLGRGNSQYLARLEGAIGHILCHLEGKG